MQETTILGLAVIAAVALAVAVGKNVTLSVGDIDLRVS